MFLKLLPIVFSFSSVVCAFPQTYPAGNYSGHAYASPTGYRIEVAPKNSSNGYATTTYHPHQNATATTSLRYYQPTPSTHLNSSDACDGPDPFGFNKPSSNHTKEKLYEPKFNFHDYIGSDAKLKPAIDVRVDPSDHRNIKPGRAIKLPYISEKPANENTVVAADVAFDFDDDTVVLEHFYDLVDDLSCDSKKGIMWLAFTSKAALQQAVDHWPTEGGMNIIAPLTGPNCDVPNERGAYRVVVIEVLKNKRRMKLRYKQKEWKDIATNVEADFGQLEYSAHEKEPIQARDVLLRKRGFFSGIKKAFKKVVGVVKDVVGGIKKVINKITDWSTIKWDPSVSFGVSVGPFGDSDSPFGKALTLYDSSNGGWPKGLSWQQLNKQITAGIQTNLKERDLSNLNTEDFLTLIAEAELERLRLSKRAEPEWFQAGAWCVNCFAKANLKLAGHLKYNVLGFHLKELWITFGGDMEANIAFGLMLKSQNDITQSKEIIRVPVGPGIVIPGIFSLGCTLPVSVGVTLHTDMSFLTLVGANFKWPDMGVTINIKGGHGESHGWEPVITWTKPDLDDLSVSASVEVSTTIAFEVGVTVLSGLFSENAGVSGTVGVGEKIIYNRPDLSQCTGLNLITYIRVGVQAYVQRVKTWNLWDKVWNIADICLWQKKITATTTPLRIAAPPPTTLQTRVISSTPLVSTSGSVAAPSEVASTVAPTPVGIAPLDNHTGQLVPTIAARPVEAVRGGRSGSRNMLRPVL